MNAKKTNSLFSILLILVILWGCSKDESGDNWNNCYDCEIDSWIGSWSGKASVYQAQSNVTTDGFDINIQISETGNNYLTVYMNIPNQYSSTISGGISTGYAISFAGSNNSLTATLFQKKGKLKLSGTAKKFHYKVNELVIETVITFDVTPAENK